MTEHRKDGITAALVNKGGKTTSATERNGTYGH